MKRHSNNDEMLTYEETKFWGLLRIAKFEPLKNWSTFWAIIITSLLVAYFLFIQTDFGKINVLAEKLTSTLLGASAGIFGIVIAALTLTITLFHQKLLPTMVRMKLLHRYLFPFWFAVALWAVNIVICLVIMFLQVFGTIELVGVLFCLLILLFLFSTFYTVSLTGLVIQLALQRAQIEE